VLFDQLFKGKVNQGMMVKETNMPTSIQQPPPPQRYIRMPFWWKLFASSMMQLVQQLKRMVQAQ